MKLTFEKALQSITSFEDTEVNDFAVITGLNGSGKTHLLNALNLGHIKVESIDPSEIVFYNYADFTLYNGDPSQDIQVQQRYNNFSNKSSQLGQKLNQDRQLALNDFHVNYTFGLQMFSEYTILNIPNFQEIIRWTDADYELYERLSLSMDQQDQTAIIQQLNSHQITLFNNLGHIHVPDIRSFIFELKAFGLKAYALQILRNSGYNRSITKWNETELAQFLQENSGVVNLGMHFENLLMQGQISLSPHLVNFLQLSQTIPNFFEGLSLEYCLNLRENIELICREIEQHLEKTMPARSLSIIRAMNEGDLLTHVNSESGFLNLHDIKVAERQYQIQWKQNEYEEFKHFKGEPSNYISKEEFLERHGLSPVETLNDVLNEYDCNGYEFKQSELQFDFSNGVGSQDIYISLQNKSGNYTTTLDALSSGERTLLALAFTIHKLKQRRVIAKLFLMDEIDSALHPSMSKRLLNVLHDLFHKKLGLSIIISSHSPSTVAFAPSGSTYVMRRNKEPRLVSASKDAALSELTEGVPSFSINYENRRQVFVESKYDTEYYEGLYQIYKNELDQEVSLNFISSGDSEHDKNGMGKANCDQVIKITNLLRSSGNKFIWGIIDWDLKNNPSESVRVLGHMQRYNIESYLLDPLLIGILLWREKMEDEDFFGQQPAAKYFSVATFGSKELQKIIDAVLQKLQPTLFATVNEEIHSYQTLSGITLTLPKWLSTYPGHELEDLYVKVFPRLNDIKRGKQSALKLYVIRKIIFDFPELAPIDLLNILKEVQKI